MKYFLLAFLLFCSMGAGPCWTKHHPQNTLAPIPVSYQAYVPATYVPVYQQIMVQEIKYVPVVENRLIYQQVGWNFYPMPIYSGYVMYPTIWVPHRY